MDILLHEKLQRLQGGRLAATGDVIALTAAGDRIIQLVQLLPDRGILRAVGLPQHKLPGLRGDGGGVLHLIGGHRQLRTGRQQQSILQLQCR